MLLDTLLSRRLLILSGKGGVGKSVVGAALAIAARDRGKRVLLLEVAAPFSAARATGARSSRGRETEVASGFFTANLDPRVVMDEYVRHVVKLDFLAHGILASPVYDRFLTAAPGLKELMVLGKVMMLEEARRPFSHRPLWDLIVLDAPATGHGLAFLKVPLAASSAIPVGPIGASARRVLALLRDSVRTALLVVARPEEMAVAEALEFVRLSEEELSVKPSAVVLNACRERRFSNADEAEVLRLARAEENEKVGSAVSLRAELRAARRQIRRRKLTHFYETRLRRTLDVPLVLLPFLFREKLSLPDLRQLATPFEAA